MNFCTVTLFLLFSQHAVLGARIQVSVAEEAESAAKAESADTETIASAANAEAASFETTAGCCPGHCGCEEITSKHCEAIATGNYTASRISSIMRSEKCVRCSTSEVTERCRVSAIQAQPKTRATLKQCTDVLVQHIKTTKRSQSWKVNVAEECASAEKYMKTFTGARWMVNAYAQASKSNEELMKIEWSSCYDCTIPGKCNLIIAVCETFYPVCADHGVKAPNAGWGGIGGVLGMKKSRPDNIAISNQDKTLTCYNQEWNA